jgi:AraC-like DNA-binding protein
MGRGPDGSRDCTCTCTLRFLRSAARACDLNPNLIAIEPQLGIEDAQIRHLALSAARRDGEANVVGNLYAESLATVLAMRLVRRYSHVRDVQVRKGGMAPGKLRRAIEFINERLEQEDEFSLGDVSEAVGLSYHHFFRVFKQSMGLSPNRYVLECRVDRAKRLLAETRIPIADIALRVGFLEPEPLHGGLPSHGQRDATGVSRDGLITSCCSPTSTTGRARLRGRAPYPAVLRVQPQSR